MNYWLYVTNESILAKINSNNKFLEFSKKNNIKKNDIIFLYIKKHIASGFSHILQASDDIKINNVNKFAVDINVIKIITPLVNISKIINQITGDVSGHRNLSSFNAKYLKNINTVTEIQLKGELLQNILNSNGTKSNTDKIH